MRNNKFLNTHPKQPDFNCMYDVFLFFFQFGYIAYKTPWLSKLPDNKNWRIPIYIVRKLWQLEYLAYPLVSFTFLKWRRIKLVRLLHINLLSTKKCKKCGAVSVGVFHVNKMFFLFLAVVSKVFSQIPRCLRRYSLDHYHIPKLMSY